MAQWRKKEKDAVYTVEEIEQRLKEELPHWFYEDGWIRRRYKTSGWKGTLMAINAVGHLAEAAWHHPRSHRQLRLRHRQADEPCRQGGHRQGLRVGQKDRGSGAVATGRG